MLASLGLMSTWVVLAIAATMVLNVLPVRHVVLIAMCLALPQIYLLPLPGSFTLFQAVVVAGLGPRLVMRRISVPGILGALLWALLAVQTAYVPFALSLGAAVVAVLNTFCLIAMSAAVAAEVRAGRAGLASVRGLRWLLLVQAVLVIVFRLSPAAELNYYSGTAGTLAAGRAAIEQMLLYGNNVLDPAKSGGLVLNANVASMVLGFGAACLLAHWSWNRRPGDLVVAAVVAGAVVATGSKTGVLLMIAMPIVYFITSAAVMRRVHFFQLGLLAAAGLGLLSVANRLFAGAFASSSDSSLDVRSQIWGIGARVFSESPLLGLTPGGWQQATGALQLEQGLPMSYPPHNMLIAAWADYGLAGALLISVIILTFVVLTVRRVANAPTRRSRQALLWVGVGMLWLFLHGQADNTGLYGALQSLPMAAMAFGLIAAASGRARTPELASAPTTAGGTTADAPRTPLPQRRYATPLR
jgi:O-antigen ligase